VIGDALGDADVCCWQVVQAWAQERQVVPLRYELWWDERRFSLIGMEQTAPGDVKLPKLVEPLFFVNPFSDDKRLFALAKEDSEFVLYADTNGNNDLTDERPFRLQQRGSRLVFGPIPMRYRINGKPVIRHIGAGVMTLGDGRVFFYLLVASRWHGTLMWDGKPVSVTVVDNDCDRENRRRTTRSSGTKGARRGICLRKVKLASMVVSSAIKLLPLARNWSLSPSKSERQ
jgi:hypothetical protein